LWRSHSSCSQASGEAYLLTQFARGFPPNPNSHSPLRRDLPQFGRHWQPYFQKTFEIYTKVGRFDLFLVCLFLIPPLATAVEVPATTPVCLPPVSSFSLLARLSYGYHASLHVLLCSALLSVGPFSRTRTTMDLSAGASGHPFPAGRCGLAHQLCTFSLCATVACYAL